VRPRARARAGPRQYTPEIFMILLYIAFTLCSIIEYPSNCPLHIFKQEQGKIKGQGKDKGKGTQHAPETAMLLLPLSVSYLPSLSILYKPF
jgi:hypothetical protein